MISASFTSQLAGIAISGNYDDLDELHTAIHEVALPSDPIAGDPVGTGREIRVSTRLLALAYDIRHAYMGDREIQFVPNRVRDGVADYLGISEDSGEIRYSVNVLYPEAIFELMAISYLIESYKGRLVGKRSFSEYDAKAFRIPLNKTIAVLRNCQATVAEAVKTELHQNSFSRWLKGVENGYMYVGGLIPQWVDRKNLEYYRASEKRRRSLIVKTVGDMSLLPWHDDDYQELFEAVTSFARENNCDISDVRCGKYDAYPQEIEW